MDAAHAIPKGVPQPDPVAAEGLRGPSAKKLPFHADGATELMRETRTFGSVTGRRSRPKNLLGDRARIPRAGTFPAQEGGQGALLGSGRSRRGPKQLGRRCSPQHNDRVFDSSRASKTKQLKIRRARGSNMLPEEHGSPPDVIRGGGGLLLCIMADALWRSQVPCLAEAPECAEENNLNTAPIGLCEDKFSEDAATRLAPRSTLNFCFWTLSIPVRRPDQITSSSIAATTSGAEMNVEGVYKDACSSKVHQGAVRIYSNKYKFTARKGLINSHPLLAAVPPRTSAVQRSDHLRTCGCWLGTPHPDKP
uniref:Uncharacterized protein n=1 Tax=Steinernema glaseri TaxID=37863 RepID=A0A1I7YWU9_9BILA